MIMRAIDLEIDAEINEDIQFKLTCQIYDNKQANSVNDY